MYLEAVEKAEYYYENINWLQKRFPEAKYQDVVGLCKMADKEEYAVEQDYSLNAGRYVGVEIESENITHEEFIEKTKTNLKKFELLTNHSEKLANKIIDKIKEINLC